MSIINVILPDGATYQTAEAIPSNTTTIINTVEERHEVTHTTEELEVPNVMTCDIDKAYDAADSTVPDPLVRSQQRFNEMPDLLYGNRFAFNSFYHDHENDNDPTTDSSSIKMYRSIFIEPPPNKAAGFPAPTMFTSGSICVCGEGALCYIPYSVSGQQIPNTKYILGRVGTGDRSHDNDGLLMAKEVRTHVRIVGTDSVVTRIHQVHICPDPTDPAILIESQRDSDFIKFVNRGPDEDVTDENTVFKVNHIGHIESGQIQEILNNIENQTTMFHQVSGLAEENDINITDIFNELYLLKARVTQLELDNPS